LSHSDTHFTIPLSRPRCLAIYQSHPSK